MDYKINFATKTQEFTNKVGVLMYKYELQLEGIPQVVALNQKASTPPPTGMIKGEITETQFGLQFKKDYNPTQTSSVSQNYSNVQTAKPTTDFRSSREIIRTDSLNAAIDYVSKKANLMSQVEAIKFMTGKEVIEVADYFRKYIEGQNTVVSERTTFSASSPANEVSEQELNELFS